MSKSAKSKARKLPEKVLVFGEDENDTRTVEQLLLALHPALGSRIITFRRPPLLIKDAKVADLPSRAQRIADLINAERETADVVAVLAHEDCDAVEPANVKLREKIEKAFASLGYEVFPVTPAWEMEAWFFLWPDALHDHRPSWKKLTPKPHRNVGMIANAKETLRRELRPGGSAKTRDYRESDAPEIAGKVGALGLANSPIGTCASFAAFVADAAVVASKLT